MSDQPTATPTTPPPLKISEAEAEAFELTSYLLVARTHQCRNCMAIQNYCDLHEVWTHPTKTALSKAKILKRAGTILPGFDIATVVTPAVDVPICHECVGTISTSHDTNRAFPPVSYSSWADTLQRKALQESADRRAAAAAKARPTPTLDQL